MTKMGIDNIDTGKPEADLIWETPFNASGSLIDVEDVHSDSLWDVEMSEALLGKHDGQRNTQEQKKIAHDFELSHAGPSLSLTGIQTRSPLDNLIATITSESNPTGSLNLANNNLQQTATHYHSRELQHSRALSAKPLPHCFNCNSLLVGNPAPKQIQVEELQEMVRLVNTEWRQRMEPLEELRLRCNPLLPFNLFERAIRTLRDFTRGKIAQTFEDVFAMMHLAFATAFSLRWQHEFDSCNAFCEDALQWQHGLSSDNDKALFRKAISCWWPPEQENPPLINDSYHIDLATNALPDALHCNDQGGFLDTLRNGGVFKACIGFLDGKSNRT